MTHRLYLPPPLAAHSEITLQPDRAHYLTRVLRLRPGAPLVCADGAGHEYAATLADAAPAASGKTARAGSPHPTMRPRREMRSHREMRLQLGDLLRTAPPPEPRLHLVQGLLKGDAMDRLLQKATELGVTDIWPVDAARSNVPRASGRDAVRHEHRRQHWHGILVSALEQSGRLWLPELHPTRDLAAVLQDAPCERLLLLQPGAPPLPLQLPREPLALLIGPEGGWDERELALAVDTGATTCGLGELILRAETAPLAALAAIRHGWGWR